MLKMKEKTTLQYVLLGLVCLLLITSTVQAVQITKMKSDGTIQAKVSEPVAQPGPAPPPAAAQPAMVGGC